MELNSGRCPHKGIFLLNFVTMENNNLAPAAFSGPVSDACRPADEKLLNRYSAQLIADDVPWRKRTFMLDAARRFLDWWRSQYDRDKYEMCSAAGNGSGHESMWATLRESYLRLICPDRELRADERAYLNGFLRFIDADSRDACSVLVPQQAHVRPDAISTSVRRIYTEAQARAA